MSCLTRWSSSRQGSHLPKLTLVTLDPLETTQHFFLQTDKRDFPRFSLRQIENPVKAKSQKLQHFGFKFVLYAKTYKQQALCKKSWVDLMLQWETTILFFSVSLSCLKASLGKSIQRLFPCSWRNEFREKTCSILRLATFWLCQRENSRCKSLKGLFGSAKSPNCLTRTNCPIWLREISPTQY